MVIVVAGGRGRDGDSEGIGGGWLLMVGVIVQVDIGAMVVEVRVVAVSGGWWWGGHTGSDGGHEYHDGAGGGE